MPETNVTIEFEGVEVIIVTPVLPVVVAEVVSLASSVLSTA